MDWVWYSTEESREKRQVSILAIFEMILAVSIYWGIALYYDWYGHIWVSVAVAPFLLFKNSKSDSYAIKLLKFLDTNKFYIAFFIFSIILITVFFVLFLDINYFFKNISIDYPIATKILFFIFIFAATTSLLKIVTIQLIKAISIFKFINSALFKIIDNWIFQNFILDFKMIPEILYGIEKQGNFFNEYKLSYYYSHMFLFPKKPLSFKLVFDWLIEILVLLIYSIILFSFCLVFRLSIKSTFWFYLPLLFLVKSPSKVSSSNEIGMFLSRLFDNYVAKIRFLLAAFVIVAFLFTSINGLKADDENTPFWFIISSIYVYFSDVELWKALQVIVALITIILFGWSNYEWKPKANNNIPFEFKGSVWFIYYLNRSRNLLSFFYFLFAIIFISFYFQVWNYKYMPAWAEGFLNWSVKIVTYRFG